MADLYRDFLAALELHQAGRLAEAEAAYGAILAADPNDAASLHRLGVIAIQTGRYDDAVDLIGRAIAAAPTAEFHNSVALALLRLGRPDEAAEHLTRVLALKPDSADVWLNLGAIRRQQGRLAEAASHYVQALIHDPKFAEAHYNLGLVFRAQGQLEKAAVCHRRALKFRPNDPAAHSNLGVVLKDLGQLDEAEIQCRRAVELKPDSALAQHNLGVVLNDLGRLDEAVACCRQALALDPNYAAAFNTMGIALKELGRLDEAASAYRDALWLQPNFAEAYYNFGAVLKDQGRMNEAIECYERVLTLQPGLAEAKFALCMAQLPPLYETEAEIVQCRAAYAEKLQALHDDPSDDLSYGVGASQPFYLAYQGQDDRDLQRLYGELVCRAMAGRFPPAELPPPPAPGEKIRVGIVSGYFYRHANWNMPIAGWLTHLDRNKFELFGYHTGAIRDAATDAAAALCTRFVHGKRPVEIWRDEILADAPHVLIYPEIGMDPMAVQLAAQRLAQVQCNAWGHPDTGGLPTLDYFLTSDLMEPPDAQGRYTERLVRLPNLSVYVEPAEISTTAITRAELGLRADATVYWCGQSLYKYLPRHDEIFPRIAQHVPGCQFAFIDFPGSPLLTEQFRNRLRRAFAAVDLNADEYCVFLARMDAGHFRAATGQSDIVLDSIGWSGCNSLLDALAYDRPIVTLPGDTMRSWHGLAILTRMGVTETVAADKDAYVALAVRLARDVSFRASAQNRVAANKHRLYRDEASIVALEDFLTTAARSGS